MGRDEETAFQVEQRNWNARCSRCRLYGQTKAAPSENERIHRKRMSALFLCSTGSRSFVPTCRCDDAARRCRQGWPSLGGDRRSGLARPRLDGGEHGVKLGAVGHDDKNVTIGNRCYIRSAPN
jgi:hypothetical protein